MEIGISLFEVEMFSFQLHLGHQNDPGIFQEFLRPLMLNHDLLGVGDRAYTANANPMM